MAQPSVKQWSTRQVRALERGFDNITLREPGEVFSYSGPPGKWLEDVPAGKVKRETADDLA